MNCDDCRSAEWRRTKNGRLHPDKSGRCMYLKQHPRDMRLPAAFYWLRGEPRPDGGYIERGRELEKGCVFKDTGGRDD